MHFGTNLLADGQFTALRAIVPGEGVVDDQDGMRPYECDALSAYRQMPLVVVLPETVAQVSAILRFCQANKVKVVPRGGGTSLSGGSMPVGDAVLLAKIIIGVPP